MTARIVLPIPKAPYMRERISDMVKRAVTLRIEARRLAKEARASVHGDGTSDGV